MKCECSGDFRYVGTMSKEHTHHIVIECVKCKKAHNIFYFKDLAEEQEARAEKAEVINKKIWEALCENCQYYCLFKCRYAKGDETCKGCVSTDSHTCPSAEYETCPIVAKAKEGL